MYAYTEYRDSFTGFSALDCLVSAHCFYLPFLSPSCQHRFAFVSLHQGTSLCLCFLRYRFLATGRGELARSSASAGTGASSAELLTVALSCALPTGVGDPDHKRVVSREGADPQLARADCMQIQGDGLIGMYQSSSSVAGLLQSHLILIFVQRN